MADEKSQINPTEQGMEEQHSPINEAARATRVAYEQGNLDQDQATAIAEGLKANQQEDDAEKYVFNIDNIDWDQFPHIKDEQKRAWQKIIYQAKVLGNVSSLENLVNNLRAYRPTLEKSLEIHRQGVPALEKAIAEAGASGAQKITFELDGKPTEARADSLGSRQHDLKMRETVFQEKAADIEKLIPMLEQLLNRSKR